MACHMGFIPDIVHTLMLHGSFHPALELGHRIQEGMQLCTQQAVFGLGEAINAEKE